VGRTAGFVAVVTLALVVAGGAASTPRVQTLQAWAKFWRSPAVVVGRPSHFDGAPVKHVRAGTYRVSVYATDMLGFQLVGPGINRHTPVALAERAHYKIITTTWRTRLRRGLYQYRGIGPYASTSRGVTGSFRVP
jgi:hypothetical protein